MQLLSEYLKSIDVSQEKAADAEEKFRIYRDFLIERNKLFNLTAITDPHEIVIKHFLDSLSALPFVKGNIADIGTGAGFPGIPLSILKPESEFTLVDSLYKRINFLSELTEKINASNVKTVHSRAEDLDKNIRYDTVVSRAVSRLNTLSEYCLPFVKNGGLFIAYKAADCDEEIREAENAIKILGGEILKIEKVNIYGSDIERKLVLIKKVRNTPPKYPRSQNKPKKQPL